MSMIHELFSLIPQSVALIEHSFILAQTQLETGLGGVVKILQRIALVLFFGGIIFGSVSYMYGRPEGIKNALVGAAIGILGWIILESLFTITTGSNSGITIP